MKIALHNIGKIHDAALELNGITAIAGENNTGKSTVGKALFTIFNSLYRLSQRVEETKFAQISSSIRDIFDKFNPEPSYLINANQIARMIQKDKEKYLDEDFADHADEILKLLKANLVSEPSDDDSVAFNREMAQEMVEQIHRVLEISKKQMFIQFFGLRVNREFAKTIVNYHHPNTASSIKLSIKNNRICVALKENKIDDVDGLMDLQTQAVYLDDPFLLDEIGKSTGLVLNNVFTKLGMFGKSQVPSENEPTHRAHLKACLQEIPADDMKSAIQQILVDDKIQKIIDKIDGVCHMEARQNGGGASGTMFFEAGKQRIPTANISTGLKTFLILKQLLYSGHLEENGLLILDEPEVHLHPAWQILFAEIIVLLQKEFGMHILLTTHSPYFLRAVEVYSARYRIADRCKYYLADLEGEDAVFRDVTTATDEIYQKLVLPFEELQRMIYDEDN